MHSQFNRTHTWLRAGVVFVCWTVWMLCASTAPAAYTTILNNGPSNNRVDIVFLGDGYTATQQNTYQTHINAMMSHMFNNGEDPFPRYRNFFNAHRINVVSAQSGADDPNVSHFVNTALDATYRYDGFTQRLLYINDSKANAALASGLGGAFAADMKYVTVNATQYGGGGGTYAVYAGGNSSATEVALHEVAHSFSRLADEYGGNTSLYTGGEPSEVNVTKNSTGAKWAHWLGYNQPGIGVIGAYEGARYYDRGLYRPSQNSKMRSLGVPFDAVSREKIILDIYRLVDPLDAWLANTGIVTDPAFLWVDPVDSAVIDHQWYVNGILVPGATGEQFNPLNFGYGPGTYNVRAYNYDPTDWVRINRNQLEQNVTWTVKITVPEPSTLLLCGCALLGVLACKLGPLRISR